jgi:hypothetical protein
MRGNQWANYQRALLSFSRQPPSKAPEFEGIEV